MAPRPKALWGAFAAPPVSASLGTHLRALAVLSVGPLALAPVAYVLARLADLVLTGPLGLGLYWPSAALLGIGLLSWLGHVPLAVVLAWLNWRGRMGWVLVGLAGGVIGWGWRDLGAELSLYLTTGLGVGLALLHAWVLRRFSAA